MAIQLVIRDNLEGHAATFRPGDLRTFDRPCVRIGTRAQFECVLPPASGLPDLAATLTLDPPSGEWSLTPAAGVQLFLNQEPLVVSVVLRSGDEIRVGHWTFRFHRQMVPVRYARRADLLAVAAKILVALILAVEIGVVSWLPRQVQRARLWELQIARQRTTLLLDDLRQENLRAPATTELEQAARRMVAGQLDSLALHLRRNQDRLTREQWRSFYSDLDTYRRILTLIQSGKAFPTPPPVDLDAAVHGVLGPRGTGAP